MAISGGGHRASLFGLGALLYLADSKSNSEVTSIASVSGGSLTNGFVAQSLDYQEATGEEFRAAVQPFAARMARGGTLWASPLTWAYVVALALIGLAMMFFAVHLVVDFSILRWATWIRFLVFLGALVALALFAELRGVLCARAFARTLFSPGGSPTALASIHATVDHVLCATDLHAGEHVYFSGRFVCAYRFGWGKPGDLPLHLAVQASAALPGAFPVRWLRTARHGFVSPGDAEAGRAAFMALTDGGVYDNMADQWPQGVGRRNERWAQHHPDLHDPGEIVVVNASAALGWGPVWKMRIPLLGELLALLKDKSVLYDNGTSVRRTSLVEQFNVNELLKKTPTGALVHIAQSPYDVAGKFATDTTWPGRAQRAGAVLALLRADATTSEADWAAIAKDDPKVKTTLSALGIETSARLLRHAYVLSMANLHVILGFPLPAAIPPLSDFTAFVGGGSPERGDLDSAGPGSG